MRFTTASAAILLHLAAAPCQAESKSPSLLDLLNISSQKTSLAALPADPDLPIPPDVPTEIDLGDGGRVIRITDYYSPFVSSYNVLPCLVEMLAAAFENASAGNQKLPRNQFVCQQNGLELKLVGNQITPPLEYSDLVRLARLVLEFQQRYKMPGIEFYYLDGRRIQGWGYVYMLLAGNSTVGGVVEE